MLNELIRIQRPGYTTNIKKDNIYYGITLNYFYVTLLTSNFSLRSLTVKI